MGLYSRALRTPEPTGLQIPVDDRFDGTVGSEFYGCFSQSFNGVWGQPIRFTSEPDIKIFQKIGFAK